MPISHRPIQWSFALSSFYSCGTLVVLFIGVNVFKCQNIERATHLSKRIQFWISVDAFNAETFGLFIENNLHRFIQKSIVFWLNWEFTFYIFIFFFIKRLVRIFCLYLVKLMIVPMFFFKNILSIIKRKEEQDKTSQTTKHTFFNS